MHTSTHQRMQYLVNWYKPYWDCNQNDTVKILDIGSCGTDVTYRSIFENDSRYHYEGLDMVPGPNVDIIPNNIFSWDEIADASYDLVISGQAFEHIQYPWITIKEVERILKPGGCTIITAPSGGFEHKCPIDCFRYYPEGFRALANSVGLTVHHTSCSGVPSSDFSEEWTNFWNDTYLVAQKAPVAVQTLPEPFPFEKRFMPDGSTQTLYTNEQIALSYAIQKGDSTKPYIIFGAALCGEKILSLLGDENVFCFADNSPSKIGTELCGKKIISANELAKIHNDYNVIVATIAYHVSVEIRKQLNSLQIPCQILFFEETALD